MDVKSHWDCHRRHTCLKEHPGHGGAQICSCQLPADPRADPASVPVYPAVQRALVIPVWLRKEYPVLLSHILQQYLNVGVTDLSISRRSVLCVLCSSCSSIPLLYLDAPALTSSSGRAPPKWSSQVSSFSLYPRHVSQLGTVQKRNRSPVCLTTQNPLDSEAA